MKKPTFLIIFFFFLLLLPSCALFSTQPEEEELDPYTAALTHGYLLMGMPMNDVTSIWGEPAAVETAGDPRSGNQKWLYPTGLVSNYGLGGGKEVFFENGRVAGWRSF